MNLQKTVAKIAELIRFAPNSEFNDTIGSLHEPKLCIAQNGMGFYFQWESGERIAMHESGDTLFGNVIALDCNASGQIVNQAQARHLFNEVLEFLTAPAQS